MTTFQAALPSSVEELTVIAIRSCLEFSKAQGFKALIHSEIRFCQRVDPDHGVESICCETPSVVVCIKSLHLRDIFVTSGLARMLLILTENAMSLGGSMVSICARFKMCRETFDAAGGMRL